MPPVPIRQLRRSASAAAAVRCSGIGPEKRQQGPARHIPAKVPPFFRKPRVVRSRRAYEDQAGWLYSLLAELLNHPVAGMRLEDPLDVRKEMTLAGDRNVGADCERTIPAVALAAGPYRLAFTEELGDLLGLV